MAVALAPLCRDDPPGMSPSIQPDPAPEPGRWSGLGRWLNLGWVDPERATADFRLQTDRDLRGDKVHATLAFVWGVLIVGPMTLGEAAIAFPGVCWLVRLFVVPRAARWVLVQPSFVALSVWTAWHLIACTWSSGGHVMVEQAGVVRFAVAMIVLFPIMHHRGVVIAGLATGLLLGNVSQLVNWIGVKHDVSWLVVKAYTDRNGGWWPVTYGAQHLVAAFGLHFPVAVMGRGKWRVVGAAGTLATTVGLIATGARGSWIAAVLLAVVVLIVAIVRIQDRRRRAVFAGGAVAASLVAAAAVWFLAGIQVQSRFAQAADEISRAIEHRDFEKADGSRVGDDSSRVAMLGWSIEAIREHPILGVGTGGYYEYVKDTKRADGAVYDDFVRRGHGHGHNALLHEWATTGLVGLVITLVAAFVALWSAFAALSRETLATYAAGPAFALLGYLMLWPFEAIEANSSTSKMMFALIAICPAWVPSGFPSLWKKAGGRPNGGTSAPTTHG